MGRKRQAEVPEQHPPAPAPVDDHDGQHDADEDGDKDDEEQDVRLVRSVVHDEFTQTSEKKEIKRGGKKKKCVTWKSSCNHCDVEFTHKKTSVLKRHLKSKHPAIGKMVEDTDDFAREAQKADRDTPSVTRKALIIDQYLRWLMDSGAPLSTSDNKEFKKFVELLDKEITIPGRRAITELLDKKFVDMMSKLRKRLANARRVHLTMDGWSNRRCRSSFLGATVHFYNEKKRCQEAFRLCLRKFNCRHTAQNIMEMTQKILDDYDIRQKTQVINTDNGSNIRKGMNDLSKVELPSTELDVNMNAEEGEGGAFAQDVQDEFLPELISDDPLDDQDEADEEGGDAEDKERDAFIQKMEDQVKEFDRNWRLFGITPMRCSAHLIQLPIMKILRDETLVFRDLLVKVRNMVKKYSKSVNAKIELDKLVHMMVVTHVPTRWWSDIDMMARVKKIDQEDPSALNKVIDLCQWDEELKLERKDWALIDKFLALFKPIQLMSDQLSGEKYSSIHMVLPTIKDIKEHIEAFKTDKLIGKTVKTLLKEFENYFRYSNISKPFSLLTD